MITSKLARPAALLAFTPIVAVFLIAGINKAGDLPLFGESIAAQNLVPKHMSMAAAFAIVVLELGIGLAALHRICTGGSLLAPLVAAGVLLVLFTGYAQIMTELAPRSRCGCGLGAALTWNGVVLRNSIMLVSIGISFVLERFHS